MNEANYPVGSRIGAEEGHRAFVAVPDLGERKLPPVQSPFEEAYAYGVKDQGQIVGTSGDLAGGEPRPVL